MTDDEAREREVKMAVAVDREALRGQLEDLVAKIDAEGLDYFLTSYGGAATVPDEPVGAPGRTLRSFAQDAADALERFEHALQTLCGLHDVEYEP